MASELNNGIGPLVPATTDKVSKHDGVVFNYLTKLVAATYRPLQKPVVFMGRYVSRGEGGEGVEKFRASVVGRNWLKGPTAKKFLIPPQNGPDCKGVLMAVIRLVEDKAHKRMAGLKGKDAESF